MSEVLVTGANGFVGRHLLNELLVNDVAIIAVGGTQAPKVAESENLQYLTLDLNNYEQVKQIDFSNISGVVHLAGLAAVGPSFNEPMNYINTNMGIEVNLFEAALNQKVTPRFLIVSSATLYDPKAPQPLSEESPVLPNSPYAVSKLGQEMVAKYYSSRGFEAVIARPFNHIGPGQKPGFIVPDIAGQILTARNTEQGVVKVGNLDAKRDYTDVRDIVRAYRLLLDKGVPGEIYNVCSGKALSGHEILEGLCQAAGTKPKIEQDPSKMRPSDTNLIVGSYEKIKSDTGWQPEIAIETTLSDVISSASEGHS